MNPFSPVYHWKKLLKSAVTHVIRIKKTCLTLVKIILKNFWELHLAVIIFFDSIVHQQRDGVAMDSLFGARLGIAFLAHYKQIWLNVFPDEFNPVYYKRYVDDIPDLFDLLTILKNLMNI